MPKHATEPRIFLFTLHKCASVLLHRVGLGLASARGLRYVSPNSGGIQVTIEQLASDPAQMAEAGCYGPLRIPLAVPRIEEASVVLHLRDPRDALVSMYYSYCYSHPGDIPGGTGYRQQVAERGIDAFVLAMATSGPCPVRGNYGTGAHLWPLAGNFQQRYRRYVDELVGRPNVVLLRYEDMVRDFGSWLAAVAGPFQVATEHPVLQQLVATQAPAPAGTTGSKWSHQRRVTPGDHREQLRPETIAHLDEAFADCLDALGYT